MHKTRWKRVLQVGSLSIAAALAVAAAVGWTRFTQRAQRVYQVVPAQLALPSDRAALAHGDHFAHTLGGCAECHGDDFGGKVMSDDFAMRLVAPNLTQGVGGAVHSYETHDWWNAIQHGVDRSGHSLLVMPSSALRQFSAADIAAVIAYLRSVPPVDRDLGHSRVKPVGAILLGLTQADVLSAEDLPPLPPPAAAPQGGETRAYGEYLSTACRGCHGGDLRGGKTVQPGEPVSADISPQALAGWEFASFERALRQGIGRDGRVLSAAMPWRATRGLTTEEMRALWMGLRQE
jgi:mono/diheme cytochrome c family protein